MLHLLTLVTLDLKGISCSMQQEEDAEYSIFQADTLSTLPAQCETVIWFGLE